YNAAADFFDAPPMDFSHRIGRRTVERMSLQPGARVAFQGLLVRKTDICRMRRTGFSRVGGAVLLQRVKTVEVERWLREATVSNGTRAKIKCVMSALFSHAVRWEFTSPNPISSGIPVGTGGKLRPSTGVRGVRHNVSFLGLCRSTRPTP